MEYFELVSEVYDKKTLEELWRIYPTTKRPLPSASLNNVIRRGSRYDVLLSPRFPIIPRLGTLINNAPLLPWCRALIAPAKSAAQPWHRDDEEAATNYFTLITALDDLDETMPLTEFLDYSAPVLKANEGIIFSGNIEHRGGAGVTARAPVVYQVFTRGADPNTFVDSDRSSVEYSTTDDDDDSDY